MNEPVLLIGYVLLLACVIAGIAKYRFFDRAMRIVVLMLSIGLLTELTAYAAVRMDNIPLKGAVYHVYSIIEMVFISAFFIALIKPCHHRKWMFANIIVWPVLGVLNIIFLQPLDGLNTNFLMLESFSIISMSLYFIYWSLKKNSIANIFKSAYFWMAIAWLVYWSGTFFFWAFITILYSDMWPYINEAITALGVLVIITYSAFLLIFLLYPKNFTTLESY